MRFRSIDFIDYITKRKECDGIARTKRGFVPKRAERERESKRSKSGMKKNDSEKSAKAG